MKKTNMRLLLLGVPALIGCAILAGCGGDSAKGGLSFSSYDFNLSAEGEDSDSLRNVLDNFDGRWAVSLNGILPESLGNADITELRDSLMELASLKADESGKLEVSLPSYLKRLDKKDSPDSIASKTPGSTFTSTTTLDLLTPKYAVFRVFTYSYPEGAAHGGYANTYLNYNIEKGTIITQTDILTDGFAALLRPAIHERLSEQGAQLLVEKEDFFVSRNFRLTTDGIEFIYGIYQVAPYSEGELKAFFTYPELSSILKPAGKALLLGTD